MNTDTRVESDDQLATSSLPLWTVAAAVLTAVAIVLPVGPGAKALAMLGIVLVPGASVTAIIGVALDGATRRMFVAAVVGVAVLLGVGLVSAVVLRPLGVAHPLTRGPTLVVWILVLVASVVVSARLRRDPVQWLLAGVDRRNCTWLIALAALPALALLGAGRLDAGHGGALAVGVSAVCVAVLVLALASALWQRIYVPVSSAIFMAVVALVWQVSSRGEWLFGSDIQHEYFVANHAAVTGQFSLTSHHDAYQAMLPLTVLPAQLHALTNASVEILLQLLPALVLGLVAVGALCIFRALVSEGLAVGFTLLFVGVNTALLTELPAVTRQCYALLMFEAVILLIVLAPAPLRRARALAAALGVAMAGSHYSTAFIAVPVLALGWIAAWRFSEAAASPSDGELDPEQTGVARWLKLQRQRMADLAHQGHTVLSGTVVGVSAVATVVWGLVIAGSGTQLSQLRRSLQDNGLAIFPSSGGVLTRWINASTSTSVSAKVLQHLDQVQTKNLRPWLRIDPRALQVHLANASAPKRSAVAVLKPTSSTLLAIANEIILAASVVVVIVAIVGLVRGRHRVRVEFVGMAVGALVIDAIARVSGTIAQSFGPERVQVQLGVLLLVPLAVVAASTTRLSPRALKLSVLALVVIELAGTTGLSVMAFGGVPAAKLSATGENVERFVVTAPALYTAGWTVDRAGDRIIQSDRYGALALADFTGATRKKTIDSVDPIAVDRSAWIFVSPANVVQGRARGAVNGSQAVFAFPRDFYDRTRPIIFATSSTKVYGPA